MTVGVGEETLAYIQAFHIEQYHMHSLFPAFAKFLHISTKMSNQISRFFQNPRWESPSCSGMSPLGDTG